MGDMRQVCCILLSAATLTAGCGPSSKPDDPNLRSGPNQPASKDSTVKAEQYRLEWNRDTLVGDYERFGSRNAKWDGPAKQALEDFVQLRAKAV